MPQPPQPVALPYEDDPSVTEIFVDGPVGFNFYNGNMHITFFTVRIDHGPSIPMPATPGRPASQVRRVTSRLVMPLQGALDLQQTIANMLQMLRKQGLITAHQGPQTRQ